MKTINRRLVMSKDLNGANKLFGGSILAWVDEQAYVEVIALLKTDNVVTKFISEVNFISGAKAGHIVEIATTVTNVGRTSMTLKIEVFNATTNKEIATVNEIVMVNVDENDVPTPHNYRWDA